MPNMSQMTIGNVTYDLTDTEGRAQLNKLGNAVLIITSEALTFAQGNLDTVTGGTSSSSQAKRIRSDYVPVDAVNGFSVTIPNTYGARIFYYTSEKSYTNVYDDWFNGEKSVFPAQDGYVRVLLSFENGNDITPSDVSGVYFYNKAFTDKTLSIDGKAADSKTVGDFINGLTSEITEGQAQLEDLKADLNGLDNAVLISNSELLVFTQGSLDIGTGATNSSSQSKRVRSDYVQVNSADGFSVIIPQTYGARILYYTSEKVYTNVYDDWFNGEKRVFPAQNGYIRILLSLISGNDMTPSDVAGVYLYNKAFTDKTLSIDGKAADSKTVGDFINGLTSGMKLSKKQAQSVQITSEIVTTWTAGYRRQDGVLKTSDQYEYSQKFSVNAGDVIYIDSSDGYLRFVCAYDSGDSVVAASGLNGTASSYTVPSGIVNIIVTIDPANGQGSTVHLMKTETITTDIIVPEKPVDPSVYYVSTSGNDSNDGLTASSPKATVNNALECGAETVLIADGIYEQTIDLSKSKCGTVDLRSQIKNGKVIFRYTGATIATAESAESGYTKVYKAPCGKTFENANIWIFQENVADASTLISSSERMPLQRGYANRCGDTKIMKCTSDNLSDALTEIENSSDYLWFMDTVNSVIYYSRPDAVSASKPLCFSGKTKLFSGGSRNITIYATGIESKFQAFNIDNTNASIIKNCKCTDVYGDGCFTYDGATSAQFINCEAARAFNNTNGDGFNAHSAKTGDAFAYQTSAVFIGCWSHDNRDDGFSDHERCESLIIGGLYEYNSYGGGVTPSYGSHCECHEVYCRKNGEGGFLYKDSAALDEGGVCGQIICYDCISEENHLGIFAKEAGYHITGNGNRGVFVNCKAIGEVNAFYIKENDSTITLIDCGAYNCTTIKGGVTANFTVKNTTLVE